MRLVQLTAPRVAVLAKSAAYSRVEAARAALGPSNVPLAGPLLSDLSGDVPKHKDVQAVVVSALSGPTVVLAEAILVEVRAPRRSRLLRRVRSARLASVDGRAVAFVARRKSLRRAPIVVGTGLAVVEVAVALAAGQRRQAGVVGKLLDRPSAGREREAVTSAVAVEAKTRGSK